MRRLKPIIADFEFIYPEIPTIAALECPLYFESGRRAGLVIRDLTMHSNHERPQPANFPSRTKPSNWAPQVLLGLAGAAFPIWLLSDLMHVSDVATIHALVRLGFLLTALAIGQQIGVESGERRFSHWLWLALPSGLWIATWPILDFEAQQTLRLNTAFHMPWWDNPLTKWGVVLALLTVGWVACRRYSRRPRR